MLQYIFEALSLQILQRFLEIPVHPYGKFPTLISKNFLHQVLQIFTNNNCWLLKTEKKVIIFGNEFLFVSLFSPPPKYEVGKRSHELGAPSQAYSLSMCRRHRGSGLCVHVDLSRSESCSHCVTHEGALNEKESVWLNGTHTHMCCGY